MSTSLPDAAARHFAVDPRENVVLEASAGTGKTSVLVRRYLNLLGAGVDPGNILAITFTRKAAAEMRQRIVAELKRDAGISDAGRDRWRELRDRLGDIAISTIDAFCLSLLREFPLEAGLDPSFTVADETEAARLVEESLDRALRVGYSLGKSDPDVAMLLAELSVPRLRAALRHLLDRRLVAGPALARFIARTAGAPTGTELTARVARAMLDAFAGLHGGLQEFLASGPAAAARFRVLSADLQAVLTGECDAALTRSVLDRLARHVMTDEGQPRRRPHGYRAADCPTPAASRAHVATFQTLAPAIAAVRAGHARDLNVALARAVQRLFLVAEQEHRRALTLANVVDFPEALDRAVALLGQMDEFAQSRFRLESRFHHLLIDEFQDTSRKQWELMSRLVEAWGEGAGLVSDAPLPPSIFIVGDRKQSIYRFRDAEVAVLRDAAEYIARLRPAGSPRRSISKSFRAVPPLLAFVNDLFTETAEQAPSADGFEYGPDDRFPDDDADASSAATLGEPALGLTVETSVERTAAAVAAEIERLVRASVVRDRDTGVARPARSGDIAILFRSRETHRAFQAALERRGLPTYVYKGLGFFEADEIQDFAAAMRYLAAPASELRAAALLRSRLIRLSDGALLKLAGRLSDALGGPLPEAAASLDVDDARVLARARESVRRWLALVDLLPPAELMDLVLTESAYASELAGPRLAQARENVKKMRALVRRIQNKGYATLARIAERLDRLSAGDESNAVVDAGDAVSLMTVHAAKGLEFPIVFLVNLGRGTGGHAPPVRVVETRTGEPDVSVEGLDIDAEAEERRREREETKRLLYVATTRARDRLYLAALVREGRLDAGTGSLAAVLPRSLAEVFEAAGAAEANMRRLTWTPRPGRRHVLCVCRAPADADATDAVERPAPAPRSASLFSPLPPRARAVVIPASDVARESAAPPAESATSAGDLVIGRLVHRLFQALRGAEANPADVLDAARAMVRSSAGFQLVDVEETAVRAADAFLALQRRPEVADILNSSEVRFEVPFSLRLTSNELDGDRNVGSSGPGTDVIVRGAIDCLARSGPRTWTVVEFKTGRPAAWHERQLALYVQAARCLFPDGDVSGRLIYAHDDQQRQ